MMKIAVLFTCFNRIEKTRACIESIECAAQNADCELNWFITDGGSADGTIEELSGLPRINLVVSKGAYYSQGMLSCMNLLDKNSPLQYDYVMLVNDDVDFYEDFLKKILSYSCEYGHNKTIVGATCSNNAPSKIDNESSQTYGGIRYAKSALSVRYSMVSIDDADSSCDTFNANCVLIPIDLYIKSPRMDAHFVHGLGDFDYGMCLHGDKITTNFYVGKCENNSKSGTWMDTSLSASKRIKKLNEVKGSPTKQWFYYLRKHFGLCSATLHSISPYVRILLHK